MKKVCTGYGIVGEEEFRQFEGILLENGLYLKQDRMKKDKNSDTTYYFVFVSKTCEIRESERRLQGFVLDTDYGPPKFPREIFAGHHYRINAKHQSILEKLADEFTSIENNRTIYKK